MIVSGIPLLRRFFMPGWMILHWARKWSNDNDDPRAPLWRVRMP